MKPQKLSVKELIAKGYRRTSNKFGVVSRIDRPDWRGYMALKHSPWSLEAGMDWVKLLEKTPGQAEDHYRRCYSEDTLEIGRSAGLKVPPSNWDATGYVAD